MCKVEDSHGDKRSVRDIFIAQSVYLVLNSLLDSEPVKKIARGV